MAINQFGVATRLIEGNADGYDVSDVSRSLPCLCLMQSPCSHLQESNRRRINPCLPSGDGEKFYAERINGEEWFGWIGN